MVVLCPLFFLFISIFPLPSTLTSKEILNSLKLLHPTSGHSGTLGWWPRFLRDRPDAQHGGDNVSLSVSSPVSSHRSQRWAWPTTSLPGMLPAAPVLGPTSSAVSLSWAPALLAELHPTGQPTAYSLSICKRESCIW